MIDVLLQRVVREQRRARELGLAYRIAAARMTDAREADRLRAYEQALSRLGETMARRTSLGPARLDTDWARVGALADGEAILLALRDLEVRLGSALEELVRVLPQDEPVRAVLAQAGCGCTARQSWLEERIGARERLRAKSWVRRWRARRSERRLDGTLTSSSLRSRNDAK